MNDIITRALISAMLRSESLTPAEKEAVPLLTQDGPLRDAYIAELEHRLHEAHVTRGYALTADEGNCVLAVSLPHDGCREFTIYQDHADKLSAWAVGSGWEIEEGETEVSWFDDQLGHKFTTKVTWYDPLLSERLWYAFGGIITGEEGIRTAPCAVRGAALLLEPQVVEAFERVAKDFNDGTYGATPEELEREAVVRNGVRLREALSKRRYKGPTLKSVLKEVDALLEEHRDATFVLSEERPERDDTDQDLEPWWRYAEKVRASPEAKEVDRALDLLRAENLATKMAE